MYFVGLGKQRLLWRDVLQRNSAGVKSPALKEFGKLDILVKVVGITHKEPTLEAVEAGWSSVIATNLTGTLINIQEHMPHTDETDQVFPHHDVFKGGLIFSKDAPGLGVDSDDTLAAKYPY